MIAGETRRTNARRAHRMAAPLLAALIVLAAAPAVAQDQPADETPAPNLGTDHNVTVSTRNMDLAAFLELLSVSYKLNIVSPKDVTGKVSVNFYDVPPLDALQAVLEANGYQYVLEQTAGRPIIKVQPITKVEGEVPVVMRTFLLSYTTAEDVKKAATALLSKNGSITAATNRNAVVVQDVAESVQRIEELVKTLDSAPRQVMIDAKLVELSKTDVEETGFNWSMFQDMNIADITAEASYARAAEWVDTRVSGAADTDTRNIVTTTGTNVDLRAGILAENEAQLMLDYFDTLTDTTIISRPSIRTLDNKPAHIISGQVVPIPLFDFARDTGVRTLSGFQDEEIGVELTVTPHINDDGFITLEIVPRVESIDRYITVDGDQQRPVTNTRMAETTIRIKDGNTAVIGGLTQSTTTITETGLPGFMDLPLIGWFFRNKTNNVDNSELIIFITPTIVDEDNEKLSDKEKELLKKVEDTRLIK